MHFGSDAQGLLLFIVPVIMKMNIHIVNIATSPEAQMYKESTKFSVVEGPSKQQDLMHIIEGDSAFINLYVLCNDAHYDALFSIGADSVSANPDAARRVNASFIKPHMTELNFD